MINYIELGVGLHDAIHDAGHWLEKRDGQWLSSDDVAVQAIIDAYDPLPAARSDAIERVKGAAAAARERYVTPGKDLVYEQKRAQAAAYQAAGYPADTAAYPMIQAEADATGVTAADAAVHILTVADSWMALAAQIERIERSAVTSIASTTDWTTCASTADSATAQLAVI